MQFEKLKIKSGTTNDNNYESYVTHSLFQLFQFTLASTSNFIVSTELSYLNIQTVITRQPSTIIHSVGGSTYF